MLAKTLICKSVHMYVHCIVCWFTHAPTPYQWFQTGKPTIIRAGTSTLSAAKLASERCWSWRLASNYLPLTYKQLKNVACIELEQNNLPHCRAFERREEPVLLRVLGPLTLLLQFLIHLDSRCHNSKLLQIRTKIWGPLSTSKSRHPYSTAS